MNTFAIELWYDEGNMCTFYTVRYVNEVDENLSETDKFFDKYANQDHIYYEQSLQLVRLITESIGNRYGATNDFFDRVENNAQALPPKPKKWVEEIKDLGINFPLRIFCYRVNEQIVVLFNGGIKDAVTAQESELSMRFQEASLFAKKIEKAFTDGIIEISNDGRYINDFNNTEEIII